MKFDSEQKIILKEFYEKIQYPNQQQKEKLAQKLECEVKDIQNWFTAYRFRNKKKGNIFDIIIEERIKYLNKNL